MSEETMATENRPGVSPTLTNIKKTSSKIKTKGIPLYESYKDGNGFETKVANLNNPYVVPQAGIIEVQCIKKSNHTEARYSISNAFDSDLGLWFGVPTGVDERTKKIAWQRFVIGDFRRYDLSKVSDRREWAVFSRSAVLEGSPYQRGKILYRKFDKEAEARETIERSTIRRRAMEIVDQMVKIEDLMDMYRNFGRNPEGFSLTQLQAEIIKIAERTPKDFVNMYENANRGAVTIFNRAKATGLITFDINKGGFLWKDSLPIGLTDQGAIKYLLDNPTILNQANIESKSKDPVANHQRLNLTAEQKKFFQVEDGSDEEDVELIEFRSAAKIMGIANYMSMTKAQLEKALDEATG